MLWFWNHLNYVVRMDYDGTYGQGSEYQVYRLWHQRDHIKLRMIKAGEKDKPDAAISLGSTFEIEENLLLKYHIGGLGCNKVTQFDESNF